MKEGEMLFDEFLELFKYTCSLQKPVKYIVPQEWVKNSDPHTSAAGNEQQDQAADSSEDRKLCMDPANSFYHKYQFQERA